MGNELDDEKRMTRVETILEAHETILLRIEAKMDDKFVPREEIHAMRDERNILVEMLQRQIDELKTNRRYGVQSWAFWVSAIAAVGAVVIAIWPKTVG